MCVGWPCSGGAGHQPASAAALSVCVSCLAPSCPLGCLAAAAGPCKAGIQKYCEKVVPGAGGLAACLFEQKLVGRPRGMVLYRLQEEQALGSLPQRQLCRQTPTGAPPPAEPRASRLANHAPGSLYHPLHWMDHQGGTQPGLAQAGPPASRPCSFQSRLSSPHSLLCRPRRRMTRSTSACPRPAPTSWTASCRPPPPTSMPTCRSVRHGRRAGLRGGPAALQHAAERGRPGRAAPVTTAPVSLSSAARGLGSWGLWCLTRTTAALCTASLTRLGTCSCPCAPAACSQGVQEGHW